MCSRGAHRPFENALRPRFSMIAQEGPRLFTRRVKPASPGGRHSQPGGAAWRVPSGARKIRGSAVGANTKPVVISVAARVTQLMRARQAVAARRLVPIQTELERWFRTLKNAELD